MPSSEDTYKGGIATVSASFPTQDITHKPKRMQGDSIRAQQREFVVGLDTSTQKDQTVVAPTIVTIERAIQFYESESAVENELSPLYKKTAQWLREVISRRNNAMKVLEQAGETEEESEEEESEEE